MKEQLLKFTNIDSLYKSGVYKITFKNSNKFYIGSTQAGKNSTKNSDKGFYYRWSKHIRMLEKRIHPNKYLQNAFEKHGKKNLEFYIIEICNDVIEKEQYYLNTLKPFDREIGYNIQKYADKVTCNPNINKIPIIEYNLNGNFIRIWSSTKEAASFFKTSTTNIYYVLKGKNNTACNRLWKYFSVDYKKKISPFIKINKTKKKVFMYSLNKELLNTFNSVKEASEFIKGSSGTLSYNINYKEGIYKGFIFKYSKLKI